MLELGLLGLAVLVAAGVGLYLFLSGDDGSAAGEPDRVVRDLYRAVEDDDLEAYEALLEPELRDDPSRFVIPFGSTAGEHRVGEGTEVTIEGLEVETTVEQGDWATVHATGEATIGGEESAVDETVYVRQVAENEWAVSTGARFFEANGGGAPTPTAPTNVELGPLQPERPEVGQPAPDFALIDARDGTSVRKLSDYRGKAVLLNWYATWCGPCKDEIPLFQEAAEEYPDELVVIGVNLAESRGDALGMLDGLGATFPALLDSDASVAEHYRVRNYMPSTYFIDSDGIVRELQIGEVRDEDLPGLLASIGVG